MNLELMRLVSRLLDSDNQFSQHAYVPRFIPVLRLAAAILCILLCALSHNALFTITVIAFELLRLAIKPAKVLLYMIKRLIPPVIFTALVMLPAVFLGQPAALLTVTLKVLESVLVMLMVNEDLGWKEITHAFQALHLPGIFVLTLDTAVRFLIILGRYSGEMAEAVSLRNVAFSKKNKKKEPIGTDEVRSEKNSKRRYAFYSQEDAGRLQQTGGILGTTFLVSQRMAEQTYEAMECRGFTGEYRSYRKNSFHGGDVIVCMFIVLLLVFYVYCERAMGIS